MGVAGESELHGTLTRLTRTCDIVFGLAHAVLATVATWRVAHGSTPVAVALAFWAMPLVNILFSFGTRNWNRVTADGLRAVLCVPLTSYCYVVDAAGVQRHLWLPAMMIATGTAMSRCTGTRRARSGIAIAAMCATGIGIAAYLQEGRVDAVWARDAMGVFLFGSILSVIAAQLGQSLDTARQQRTRAESTLGQLSVAIDSLQVEMERRVAVEAELHQAQKLESVGRLAAGIAHEINTPVQFVGDSLQFVSEAVTELFAIVRSGSHCPELAQAADAADFPYLSVEVPKALALAGDGLGRVSMIVRSMKTFAHPVTRAMQAADLNHALAATLVVASNELKYVADLVTDFQTLPPVKCFVSEINQAVLNIVVNAAHAIRDKVGSSTERGTLFVGTRQEGDEVVITIRDSGAGIPETVRGRVFDPFFTTKEVGKGTGQGLSIARQIVVDRHHGKLTFETELGIGTTFVITLPIAAAEIRRSA
ncbi:MAG TPA: ATP-binding protein [Kofleriaceae bacterium]